MKLFTRTVPAIFSLILLSGTVPASAQSDAGNILKAGPGNAGNLINAYMGTGLDAAGQGLNDGWVNSGKSLGKLGLDLRISAGMAFIPEAQRSYDFNKLFPRNSQTYLVPEGDVNSSRPTIYGDASAGGKVLVRSNVGGSDTTIASFTLPGGMGSSNSPSVPVLQLSIGFPGNTEVMLRHIPSSNFGDVNIGLFGMGVRHDLTQWIPKYSTLDLNGTRPFDLSVFAAFTNFNALYNKPLLELDPTAYNPGPGTYNNQSISLEITSWTIGSIISKDFRLFSPSSSVSPYLGVNYSSSNARFLFTGNYPVPVANDEYGAAHPQTTKIQNVTDPVNITRKVHTMRMNIGTRVKVGALTITAEYSLGAINTATVGLAANIQSLNPYRL